MTRVIIDDLRNAGVGTCVRAKAWVEKYGIHWREFSRNGIDADELRGIKDCETQIAAVIAAAERRENS